MGNLWDKCAKEMLVAQVVEQDVWLGTPASTSVSLGWQRGIFIACSAYMALQSSGLGLVCFFFLARFQFNSWCITSLSQLWLPDKSCCPFNFWLSSCAAEPRDSGNSFLALNSTRSILFVHPSDALKCFEGLGEKLLLNPCVLELWEGGTAVFLHQSAGLGGRHSPGSTRGSAELIAWQVVPWQMCCTQDSVSADVKSPPEGLEIESLLKILSWH